MAVNELSANSVAQPDTLSTGGNLLSEGTDASFQTPLSRLEDRPEYYTPERLALHQEYFKRLREKLNLTYIPDAQIVAVMHMFPDAYPFTEAMQQIADIHTIIPKPNSQMEEVAEALQEQGLHVQNFTRNTIEQIAQEITRPTVFMDIGGWYSRIIPHLQNLGSNFLGVVEDTKNGQDKYMAITRDFPFVSAAESPNKDHEDRIVGRNIADATELVLSDLGVDISGMNVGVIGYGKIGRGFAARMKDKAGEGQVSVSEIHSTRRQMAANSDFHTTDTSTILSSSDIICVANGDKSIKGDQFTQIKQDAYIVSVTSADDALDMEWLNNESPYVRETIPGSTYITKYTNPNTDHSFYIIADGNPINLVLQIPVGDHILLVHGELLVAAYRMLTGQIEIGNHDIDNETRNVIRNTWVEVFGEEALAA